MSSTPAAIFDDAVNSKLILLLKQLQEPEMQEELPRRTIEEEVQKLLSSLGVPPIITATELIRAVQRKDNTSDLAPAISTFLSFAEADLITRVSFPTDASADDVSSLIESVVTLARSVQSSRVPTLEIELRRVFVPKDFPAQLQGTAIGGANLKIALVKYGGKYYEPGTAPPEVLSRWEVAEDLAHQFVKRCRITEKGKYAHLSRREILQQYLDRLLHAGWGKDADMRWVIRRTAFLLEWDIPEGF